MRKNLLNLIKKTILPKYPMVKAVEIETEENFLKRYRVIYYIDPKLIKNDYSNFWGIDEETFTLFRILGPDTNETMIIRIEEIS